MAINFPNSPSVGDTYEAQGRKWRCANAGPPAVWKLQPGESAPGIALSGRVADYASLPSVGVNAGDAYLVDSDRLIYVYDSGWPDEGQGWGGGSSGGIVLVKSEDESRALTTDRVLDSELQVTLPPGLYFVEAFAFLDVASGSTSNHGLGVLTSVEETSSVLSFRRRRQITGSTSSSNEDTKSGTGANSVAMSNSGAMPGSYAVTAVIELTEHATVGLYWAQNSSSSNASIVRKGSMMRVTRAQP